MYQHHHIKSSRGSSHIAAIEVCHAENLEAIEAEVKCAFGGGRGQYWRSKSVWRSSAGSIPSPDSSRHRRAMPRKIDVALVSIQRVSLAGSSIYRRQGWRYESNRGASHNVAQGFMATEMVRRLHPQRRGENGSGEGAACNKGRAGG